MRYVSGPYTQGQIVQNIVEAETALTNRYLSGGVITEAAEQKDWSYRIEDLSFGRNTVKYGIGGYPAVMARFPSISMATLGFGWADQVHQAFIVNNVIKPEVWLAKYKSVYVGSGVDGRVVSLRGLDPGTGKNFDDNLTFHKQMGTGFHMQTMIEHALVATLCKKQGFWPRGNNSYGKDYSIISELGSPTHHSDATHVGRTATGSGPLAWYHDGTPFGLADVNGNTHEWCGGMRLNNGEIQILENNNGADNTKDQSAGSAEWKAILQDGSLVAPGTADTLKYDSTGADTGISQDVGDIVVNLTIVNSLSASYAYNTFQTTAATGGVTIPNILKQYGLFPIDADHGADGHYMRNSGERLPLVGGTWAVTSNACVFYLSLTALRSLAYTDVGSRLAFA
jgi:hypothetical protein